ncbi:hypothetical protein AVEN_204552-1 [Araneus ventricosus]|uniref:Uncharacterized protein n=1 Tax=Araneus ventricosus TaxID=182803 RepID=A0A4Y2MBX6_ARAVE|nr:hypothetical protein AVEN_204552-1 [Araneus ventricosus]
MLEMRLSSRIAHAGAILRLRRFPILRLIEDRGHDLAMGKAIPRIQLRPHAKQPSSLANMLHRKRNIAEVFVTRGGKKTLRPPVEDVFVL